MACPFFRPRRKADSQPLLRLPLNAFWLGECSARPDPFTPSEDLQLDRCNFGYAAQDCPRFPDSAEAEAVRFTRYRGQRLFILEKDGWPVRWGDVDQIEPGTLLAEQARAWNTT